MKVLTARAAQKAIVASLFKSGGTLGALPKTRINLGRYEKTIIGRDMPADTEARFALAWAERRRDRDGPYYVLYGLPRAVAQALLLG